jgi:ATP-binding protein involved in chromosome partitioning
VSSAKGGVGKSTLAVNLALSFSRHGLRTGILDTDIFGPSIPTLLGLEGAGLPDVTDKGELVPLRAWGIGSMSVGYLLGSDTRSQSTKDGGKEEDQRDIGGRKEGGKSDPDGPLAWRGLILQKALTQLLFETQWATPPTPELDVLVLDLPPGTGDVQLTIGQQVILDGAVVVTTPQDVALRDAVRGVKLFDKFGTRVLGLVRNMSVFICPGCGLETRVFAHSHPHPHPQFPSQSQNHHQNTAAAGAPPTSLEQKLSDLNLDLLGDIPLDPQICYDADNGMPTIVAEEARKKRKNSVYYDGIAEKVARKVGLGWKSSS